MIVQFTLIVKCFSKFNVPMRSRNVPLFTAFNPPTTISNDNLQQRLHLAASASRHIRFSHFCLVGSRKHWLSFSSTVRKIKGTCPKHQHLQIQYPSYITVIWKINQCCYTLIPRLPQHPRPYPGFFSSLFQLFLHRMASLEQSQCASESPISP